MAKKKTQKKTQKVNRGTSPSPPEDAMSQVALLCQNQKWREAVQLIRSTAETARKSGRGELAASLEVALPKIEYSLRRQMAAAVVERTKEFLQKEYLLDVGQ